MVERKEIYKCSVCGNIVEVLFSGGGELICCGKPMILMKEMSEEEGRTEKHRPVIDGKKVVVGSVEHPMEEGHCIEWIEGFDSEGNSMRIFLEPGQKPEATFPFEVVMAREYCNLHGLWKS